jgi:hypothetical protein
MLHFFAGVLAFFGSLFGPVQPAPTPLPPTVPAPSTTTVVNKTVYQYLPATTTPTATTKTVYQYLPGTSSPAITISPAGVTEAELTQKLATLQSTIEAKITSSKTTVYSDTSTHSSSNQTLKNLTVNGVTGLTDADIPDTITASSYLPLTGGTVTGTAIFTGDIGIGTTSPGSLLSLGGIANLTTATSTFYSTGGLNLASGCFAVNGTCISGGGSSALAGLSDVSLSSPVFGNLLRYTGSTWANVATSTLGIALSDTTGTLAVGRGGTASTTLSGILVGNSTSAVNTLTLPSFLSLSGSTLSLGTLGTANGGTGSSVNEKEADNIIYEDSTGYHALRTADGVITNSDPTDCGAVINALLSSLRLSYHLADHDLYDRVTNPNGFKSGRTVKLVADICPRWGCPGRFAAPAMAVPRARRGTAGGRPWARSASMGARSR